MRAKLQEDYPFNGCRSIAHKPTGAGVTVALGLDIRNYSCNMGTEACRDKNQWLRNSGPETSSKPACYLAPGGDSTSNSS